MRSETWNHISVNPGDPFGTERVGVVPGGEIVVTWRSKEAAVAAGRGGE